MAVAVDDVSFPILGKRDILMKFGPRTIKLKEVMYSPNIGRNLMLGPRFDVNGATFLGRRGEFKHASFKPLNEIRSKNPLELLYADIWGPSQTRRKNGELYYLTFIDDYSRKASLYPIREKSNACYLIKHHKDQEENLLRQRVKAFHTDNGGEFIRNALENYFVKKGIKYELTNIYTPEQNGIPERYNQTVISGARTILDESGLHKSFWTEAMIHFTYNWNRVCYSNQTKSPLELYIGHKPYVRHLKPFGCLTYVGVPKAHRSKLDARAQKGYLLGYAFKTRGYRVWLPEKNKVIETKNVSFDENKFYGENSGAVMGTNPYNITEIIIPSSNSSYSEDIVGETLPVSDDSLLHTTDDKDPEVFIPKTYKQAVESDHCVDWQRAMKDEIYTMHSRGVWKLVDPPSNTKPVGCRWVYTIKRDEKGKIVRFKAQLVAQGYSQIKGESFDETLSCNTILSVTLKEHICTLVWTKKFI
ncbi:Retrovirus-related Pol polyprotein from transposon TNT 1-94 [Araneus ventricosus]|uniref:Retrovirus-related Pol polyprotein from transposon TNT 1-94 n=1 Tax=Araneus ventricosus TaxID=182803 RepID=A0A4Y2A1T5_ARAVE|nr:Retrovirus-related Pol polyprotein from transposon TNT 1-94 [Araneus ventricosus]